MRKRKAYGMSSFFGMFLICLCIVGVIPKKVQAAGRLEAVTGVRVAQKTPNTVKLVWKGVKGADGYEIYRSTRKDSGYKKIKTISSVTTHTWRDYGRVPGQTYYYRVAAYGNQSAGMVSGAKSPPVKAKILSAVEQYGTLSVKNGKLVDKNQKEVQLKGVSSHGLSWFPEFINYDALKTMRDEWGVEVIRLAMYTEEYNGYCVGSSDNKKQLEKKIADTVEDAKKLGMYVIIDWHILSDGNPQKNQAQAKAFFKKLSQRYKDEKHVIYEICNEPNGGTTWAQIKSYAKVIIKTIQTYDKDAIIIVGTPTWSQDVDLVAKDPIKGYDNLMYAFHYYAATHTDWYRQKVENAIKAKLPIFVTEYGICDASGNGAIDKKQADAWVKLLDKYGISSCIWNLSNKSETSAMLQSGCKRTSNWKKSDLSDSGKWFVKMMQKSLATVGSGK